MGITLSKARKREILYPVKAEDPCWEERPCIGNIWGVVTDCTHQHTSAAANPNFHHCTQSSASLSAETQRHTKTRLCRLPQIEHHLDCESRSREYLDRDKRLEGRGKKSTGLYSFTHQCYLGCERCVALGHSGGGRERLRF